jgi:hypothetical protein
MANIPVKVEGFNGPGITNFIVDTSTGKVYLTEGNRRATEVTNKTDKQLVYSNAGLDSDGRQKPSSAPQGNNPQNGSGQNVTKEEIKDTLQLSERLSYPAVLSKDQTFIRFTSYDYSAARSSQQVFGAGKIIGEVVTSITDLVSKVYSNATYSSDVIDLYVPPNINVGYGANWGEAQLGSMASQYNSAFKDDTLSQLLGTAGGAGVAGGAQATTNLVSSILSKYSDFNATNEQALGLLTGLVFNKNEFSTFSNINFRTFNYSFLLVGRNKNEIENIEKIINIFKISMHPRSSTFGTKESVTGEIQKAPRARPPLLKFPKLWTIQYFVEGGKTNNFIPKTKFCGLQSFNLNYTPNSVFTTLSKEYGYKVPAIQIDLSFKELTTLIADEILDSSITGIPNYKGEVYEGGIDKDYKTSPGGTF